MTSSQSRIDTFTVSVTRGLSGNGLCAVPVESAHLRAVAEVDGDQRGVGGQFGRTRRDPQRGDLGGPGRFSVRVGADCGAARRPAARSTRCAGRRRWRRRRSPSTSIGSASPSARAVPGCAIRSARLGPCRARTHTVGVTDVGSGTVRVRLRLTGSSGDSAIAAAHRTPSGPSAQPGRPE